MMMSDKKLLEAAKNGEAVTVYIYQDIEYGNVFTSTFSHEGDSSRVDIGEGQVIFKMYDDEKVIEEVAECFDKQVQKTYAEAEMKVNSIKENKARFLALTHITN